MGTEPLLGRDVRGEIHDDHIWYMAAIDALAVTANDEPFQFVSADETEENQMMFVRIKTWSSLCVCLL